MSHDNYYDRNTLRRIEAICRAFDNARMEELRRQAAAKKNADDVKAAPQPGKR